MAFSSVIGASSVIKPGVVTSSTRPSSPFVGQLIYETDTANLEAYNGSAWITQNGLQLIKAQTIGSGVSSVAVTDVFSSTYTNYRVIMSNVDCSVSDNVLALTLGSSTASYYSASRYFSYASGTIEVNRNNAASAYLFASATNNDTGASFDMYQPFSNELTTWAGMTFSLNYTTVFGGLHGSATSHTGFTIATTSGTMTGGTIRVYGYANS